MKDVLDFVYIGQFDILRCSRRGLDSKPWTRTPEREALASFYKLQRAREEIERLNVEIRRLVTYIHDHRLQVEQILTDLRVLDPCIAHQLEKKYRMRRALDRVHLRRFQTLVALDGFTGSCRVGLHVSKSSGAGQPRTEMSADELDGDVEPQNGESGEFETGGEADELEHALEGTDDETDEEIANYASEGLDIIVRQT